MLILYKDDTNGKFAMQLDLSKAPIKIKQVIGTLIKDTDTIPLIFEIKNESATLFLEEIPFGIWEVSIFALDTSGAIKYEGKTKVTIKTLEIALVEIVLSPVVNTGSIQFKVTWIESSKKLVIQPGPEQSKDCHIHFSIDGGNGGMWSNYNNGKNSNFSVGIYDYGTVMRGLMQFTIPDILTGKKIVSANLVLSLDYWTKKDKEGMYHIDVYQLLRQWKSGTYYNPDPTLKGKNTAEIDGATGRERFWGDQDGFEDWHTPNVGMNDIDAKKEPSAFTTKNTSDLSDWIFDITELVTFWVENPDENYGIMLRFLHDQAENGFAYSFPNFVSGDSREKPLQHPKLIVKYCPK